MVSRSTEWLSWGSQFINDALHVEIINYYLHPVAQNEKKKAKKQVWLAAHSI